MSIRIKRSIALSVIGALLVATPAVAYIAPVDAPIVDHFRKPPSPYEAGNRGVDYEVEPGTPVRASESGTVSFAGKVGEQLFAVIQHDDGLRSTYGYLQTINVEVGEIIEQGKIVGTTTTNLHFGIRDGDEYLDPEEIMRETGAHLVPVK